jgi:hypothetical protein
LDKMTPYQKFVMVKTDGEEWDPPDASFGPAPQDTQCGPLPLLRSNGLGQKTTAGAVARERERAGGYPFAEPIMGVRLEPDAGGGAAESEASGGAALRANARGKGKVL